MDKKENQERVPPHVLIFVGFLFASLLPLFYKIFAAIVYVLGYPS